MGESAHLDFWQMPFVALSNPEISRRDESAQFSDLVTNAFSAARSREGEGRPRPPLPRSLSKLSPQPSQGTKEGGRAKSSKNEEVDEEETGESISERGDDVFKKPLRLDRPVACAVRARAALERHT